MEKCLTYAFISPTPVRMPSIDITKFLQAFAAQTTVGLPSENIIQFQAWSTFNGNHWRGEARDERGTGVRWLWHEFPVTLVEPIRPGRISSYSTQYYIKPTSFDSRSLEYCIDRIWATYDEDWSRNMPPKSEYLMNIDGKESAESCRASIGLHTGVAAYHHKDLLSIYIGGII